MATLGQFYTRRYRPSAFIAGQKGTCRKCGEPIWFYFLPDVFGSSRWTKGSWLHEGFTLDTFQEQEHYPQAKEFCEESVTVNDYEWCGSPIKYEDIRAENYACGRHMRKYMEEKAAMARHREAEAKREAQEAMEEFEASKYNEAAAWIREHGFTTLIENDYQAKPRYRRLERFTKVDVCVLKDFLENIVERMAYPLFVVDSEGVVGGTTTDHTQ